MSKPPRGRGRGLLGDWELQPWIKRDKTQSSPFSPAPPGGGEPLRSGCPDLAVGLPSVRRPPSWRGGDLNSGVYVDPRDTRTGELSKKDAKLEPCSGEESGKDSVSAGV